MTRRYDPRRAKLHLSYTRVELCETFNVRLPTLSAWVKKGLKPIEKRRPYIFDGSEVREFLKRHNKPRHKLTPGEAWCVACKRAVLPANHVVEFVRRGSTNGDFVGTCPGCSRPTHRRVRIHNIACDAGPLEVRYEDGSATLAGSGEPPRSEPSEGSTS